MDAEESRAREADAPARARERAQADLARLRTLLLELWRLAGGAGALCATVGRTVADAPSALAGIEPELPGLFTADEV